MNCLRFLAKLFMFVSSVVLLVAGIGGIYMGYRLTSSPSLLLEYLGGSIRDPTFLEHLLGSLLPGSWNAAAERPVLVVIQLLGYVLMAAGTLTALVGVLGCCTCARGGFCQQLPFTVVATMALASQAVGLAFCQEIPEELGKVLGPKVAGLIETSRVWALRVISGIMTVEVLAIVFSVTLGCLPRRRRRRSATPGEP